MIRKKKTQKKTARSRKPNSKSMASVGSSRKRVFAKKKRVVKKLSYKKLLKMKNKKLAQKKEASETSQALSHHPHEIGLEKGIKDLSHEALKNAQSFGNLKLNPSAVKSAAHTRIKLHPRLHERRHS